MKKIFTLVLLSVTACGTNQTSVTASSSGKVASDTCDDGMKDSGLRFIVSHVKDDVKHVVVLEKNKNGTNQTVDFYSPLARV